MPRNGRVIVLVVVIVLTGCAGLSGTNGDTEPTPTVTETETPTPMSTGEPTQTPAPTPSPTPTQTPTPTPTPTPDYDPDDVARSIESPRGVTITTYAENESIGMVRGKGEIYNESGNLVREFRFDGNKHYTTTGLEPGTNYTLVIPEVGFHTMPTVTTHFDPGQTDDVEIFTIPDFNSTETFQWQWRHISFRFIDDETLKLKESEIEDLQRDEFQLVGNGTYDEGNWAYRWNYKWIYQSDDHVPSRAVNISGDLRYRDFNGNWIKPTHDIGFSQHPDHRPSFRPVIDGIFGMDNFTLEYVETRRLNESTVPEPLRLRNWSAPEEIKGKEVLVFNITHWGYSERINETYYFDNESQARIFVDRGTGHVLRYQARERLSVGVGYADKYIGENPSIHVIDFYNHGDSGVEINPKDYPPYREE